MNEMINKDEMFWSLMEFSQVALYEMCGEYMLISGLKGLTMWKRASVPKIIFSKKRQTLILQENYSMKDLEPLRVFENKMCTVEAV